MENNKSVQPQINFRSTYRPVNSLFDLKMSIQGFPLRLQTEHPMAFPTSEFQTLGNVGEMLRVVF